MVTHQKIRGILQKEGFKIGKLYKRKVTGAHTPNSFIIKSEYPNKVRVRYSSGGYTFDEVKALHQINDITNILIREGFRVEKSYNYMFKRYEELEIIVSDR